MSRELLGRQSLLAALDSLEDSEPKRIDLGPEGMRVVDAPDGGLNVVPMEEDSDGR